MAVILSMPYGSRSLHVYMRQHPPENRGNFRIPENNKDGRQGADPVPFVRFFPYSMLRLPESIPHDVSYSDVPNTGRGLQMHRQAIPYFSGVPSGQESAEDVMPGSSREYFLPDHFPVSIQPVPEGRWNGDGR